MKTNIYVTIDVKGGIVSLKAAPDNVFVIIHDYDSPYIGLDEDRKSGRDELGIYEIDVLNVK